MSCAPTPLRPCLSFQALRRRPWICLRDRGPLRVHPAPPPKRRHWPRRRLDLSFEQTQSYWPPSRQCKRAQPSPATNVTSRLSFDAARDKIAVGKPARRSVAAAITGFHQYWRVLIPNAGPKQPIAYEADLALRFMPRRARVRKKGKITRATRTSTVADRSLLRASAVTAMVPLIRPRFFLISIIRRRADAEKIACIDRTTPLARPAETPHIRQRL